jgi:hypothetical protein
MPGISFDFREIEAWAKKLSVAADQIPYATSRAINDAVFETRKVLVDELWPHSVHARNPQFPSVVLHVDKSTKQNLSASIRETRETSAPLMLHAKGGTRQSKHGDFAIPMPWYRAGKQTQRGLRKSASAREIIARTPKRALRITDRGIFIGESGRLRLAFVKKQTIKVPKDVPFFETFAVEMRRRLFERLPSRLIGAVATRKK